MKKYLLLLALFLPLSLALAATNLLPPIRHSIHTTYRPGLGLVESTDIPPDWKYNPREFYHRYATLPLSEMHAELDYYYAEYIIRLDVEAKRREVDTLRQVAREYNSPRLEDEARLLDAYLIYPEINDENRLRSWEVAHQFEREGKLLLAVRLKADLFIRCHQGDKPNYYLAFRIADELLRNIESFTEEELPKKRAIYGEIAHTHYIFRDYDLALPLLEKTLSEQPCRYFFDTANLRARNTLAVYYRTVGDTEKAIHYFQSMIDSPDEGVYLRAMYSAIAYTGLGRIAAERGDCRYAIDCFRTALPIAIAASDYPYSVGLLASMGTCYLKQGEIEKARQAIDTIRAYMADPEKYVPTYRRLDLYPLVSKYYACLGDAAKSMMYADSAVVAEREYEDEFNARVLLRARQEIYEAEKNVRDQTINAQRRQIIFTIVLLLLAVGGLTIIFIQYRKKNAAYKVLAEKSRQWAADMKTVDIEEECASTETPPSNPDDNTNDDTNLLNDQDRKLLATAHNLLLTASLYKDPDLTLDALAGMMHITHATLSHAINSTGKNFNQFVNEYRIKEAIRILSDDTDKRVYLNRIAFDVGFNSRASFYRMFKQYTGLTPTEFKSIKN